MTDRPNNGNGFRRRFSEVMWNGGVFIALASVIYWIGLVKGDFDRLKEDVVKVAHAADELDKNIDDHDDKDCHKRACIDLRAMKEDVAEILQQIKTLDAATSERKLDSLFTQMGEIKRSIEERSRP